MANRLLACVVTTACAIAMLTVAPQALATGAWWHLDATSRPAGIPVEGDGELVVTAENVGDAQAPGPVIVADALPRGLRVLGIAGSAPKHGGALGETVALSCSLEHVSCEAPGPIAPYDTVEVRIEVEATAGAQNGETSTASVSGGSSPSAQVTRHVTVGRADGFGVQEYELVAEAEGGGPVTQAGAHPFQVTGSILLHQGPDAAPLSSPPDAEPAVPARDVVARLPPGLIANPSAVARCLPWQFTASVGGSEQDRCPYQTAVGVASVAFDRAGSLFTVATPVFNIEPEPGEPARFGFFVPIEGVPVVLSTGVRSGPGEDWGVNLSSSQIPKDAGISSVSVTFWGVAASALHDDARGWGCLAEARNRLDAYEGCTHFEEHDPPAFVTLPTSCTSSLSSSLEADSWGAPGAFEGFPASEPLQPLTGCASVPFSPTISTSTTVGSASSPSGFSLDLTFDRKALTSGTSVAQSNLEKTVVSLPEGLTIDPSAGVGLGACTPAQFAAETLSSGPQAGCPEDSKLGTVEVETPLLFTTVYGSLYLATPYDNPFPEPGHPGGSMIGLYVVAKSRAERGIIVKLAGKVSADPRTGRLTVSFEGDPPLQFERLNFHFREGAQAPLITPATCGAYTTTALLTPYSAPERPLTDTASFQISSGSEGSACPQGAAPFAPTIASGTLTPHAGTFSPLYVELARTDAMQEIASFSTVLPVGLTANLTGVAQCPLASVEAARRKTGIEEEQGPSCPDASLIGHSLVGTGVGTVLDYVPGKLYLSGPFRGDPLSVVSIISAVVGPFDLGTIVIRFGLHIDPLTAQVSIDPSGSEPIPTIIDGIVTHVRSIRVSIDRPDFTLNPTSCQPRPISSALTSSLGRAASVSTALHAENCNELAFKPLFKASASGKTSRKDGASLKATLAMPIKLGTQSNIKTVKVELPKQLPSRLETLQRACSEEQFDSNPAGCPKASFIGYAVATTPILPEPLVGPAIFVSHGGKEFPSLVLVLQGYGFTIDLVGATFIDVKTGITSTTFKAIPDEPVGTFKLTMPEGPFSALAANGNLCHVTSTVEVRRRVTVHRNGHVAQVWKRVLEHVAGHLALKTTFVAQNGRAIHQSTPIAVTGCAKHKPRKTHRRGQKRHKK